MIGQITEINIVNRKSIISEKLSNIIIIIAVGEHSLLAQAESVREVRCGMIQATHVTSWSSRGGGGGGTVGRVGGRFLASAEGWNGTLSGGKGGSTATPRPRGRAPLRPAAAGSGASPGASAFSSTSLPVNKNNTYHFPSTNFVVYKHLSETKL